MNIDEDSKSNAGRVVIAVVVVLAVYVLSYGPVYALADKCGKSAIKWEMIANFYGPLELAANRLGLVKYIDSYSYWWCGVYHVRLDYS